MNAKGRADRGKIQTIEKYGKVNPGSLSIKVITEEENHQRILILCEA